MPAIPAISRTMPTRTTNGAPFRWPSWAPKPLATKLPTASGRSASPVWKAVYPRAFWNHSGSENSSPNSPRLTTAAATLPSRNDRIAKRSRSRRTTLPDSPRRLSRTTKTASASTPTTRATGTGESWVDHGRPIPASTSKGFSSVHQP